MVPTERLVVMNRLGRACFAAVLLAGVLCVAGVAEAIPVKSTVVCVDSVSQVVRVAGSGCVLGREVKQVWPAGVGVPRLCVSKVSRDVSVAALSGCAAGLKVLRASGGDRVMLCVDGKSGVLRWPVTGVCNAKNEALWVRLLTKTSVPVSVPVIVPVSGTPVVVPVVSLADTRIDSGTWPMAVVVTANVVGTVYFVEGDSVVKTVADITSARSDRWAQGTIIAANTPTSITIDVDVLANGYYRVYVASSQGVLSAPAANKLTISITRESDLPVVVPPCAVKNASSVSDSSTDFVMTLDTSLTSDDTVSLPLNGVYDVSVNWGDGSRERFVSGDNNNPCHSYSSVGTYTIRISGSLEHFGVDIYNEGQWRGVDIVTTVSNFGSLGIESFSGLFYGAGNLTQVPTVLPVTVTNLSAMFLYASVFNQDIGDWNVGNVTDMSYMFCNASAFNQDIGDWNVGNVTNMSIMFSFATSFNQSLNGWDVGNVTDMMYMFGDALVFNGDVSDWNVSNVTNMRGMFYLTMFNRDISEWNVSNVTDMLDMFYKSAFNGDVSEWDVSNVTNMSGMFRDLASFNGNISEWDVSNVTNMSGMFSNASAFDQNLSSWVVNQVTAYDSVFVNSPMEVRDYHWPNFPIG